MKANNEGARPAQPRHLLDQNHRQIGRWAGIILSGLLFRLLTSSGGKASLPGVNTPLLYAAEALTGGTIVALALSIFLRLPRIIRLGAWLLLLASVIFALAAISDMEEAYDRTPAGRKELAEQQERERAETADRAQQERQRSETDRKFAEAEETTKQLTAYRDKAEGCFSWGHHLRALEDPVKESLENPDAFEHVKTELIVPGEDHDNVMMTFRAQNGFGAIRTVHVTAQLIADDCTVQNIGQPTDD